MSQTFSTWWTACCLSPKLMPDARPVDRRHWIGQGLAGAAMLSCAPLRAGDALPNLRLGVVPYQPVRQLVTLYEPIAALAGQVLGRPVRVFSAPDFERFIAEARRGEFDLVGVSGHFARLLQREHGFAPLARAAAAQESVIVVPRTSRLDSLQGLRGQRVAVSDRLALHVLTALRHLRDAGLKPGVDVSLLACGSQANALTRMGLGEADAAIGSVITIRQLKPELSAQIRVLSAAARSLTPLAYLAHPRWAGQAAALSKALLAFPATPEGQAMMTATQHGGIVALTEAELATLDGDVTEYYRQRALLPDKNE
jgi:phosphonate transport system substrate-binding protein